MPSGQSSVGGDRNDRGGGLGGGARGKAIHPAWGATRTSAPCEPGGDARPVSRVACARNPRAAILPPPGARRSGSAGARAGAPAAMACRATGSAVLRPRRRGPDRARDEARAPGGSPGKGPDDPRGAAPRAWLRARGQGTVPEGGGHPPDPTAPTKVPGAREVRGNSP